MRKLVEDPVMVGVLTPETTADGAPATLGARGEPCKGLPPPDREALLWWKWCRTFDWVPPITALCEARYGHQHSYHINSRLFHQRQCQFFFGFEHLPKSVFLEATKNSAVFSFLEFWAPKRHQKDVIRSWSKLWFFFWSATFFWTAKCFRVYNGH